MGRKDDQLVFDHIFDHFLVIFDDLFDDFGSIFGFCVGVFKIDLRWSKQRVLFFNKFETASVYALSSSSVMQASSTFRNDTVSLIRDPV